jgi:predicted transcriptional regulator
MEVKDEIVEEQLVGLDNLLEILGNPTRRVILAKLAKVPHSAPELADDLGISRQAIHSQLKVLSESGLIEPIESTDKRGGKYRIRSNISVRIEITPQYYNIKYNTSNADIESQSVKFDDMNISIDFTKIKTYDDKIKFLGDQILQIDKNIKKLDNTRKEYLTKKECFLRETKKLMQGQYRDKLLQMMKARDKGIKDKSLRDIFNLSEEILFTMFFNPQRYANRVDIDKLMDDLFFSDMDTFQRNQRFGSIRTLLEDMSRLMGFLREDEDSWFFDF